MIWIITIRPIRSNDSSILHRGIDYVKYNADGIPTSYIYLQGGGGGGGGGDIIIYKNAWKSYYVKRNFDKKLSMFCVFDKKKIPNPSIYHIIFMALNFGHSM